MNPNNVNKNDVYAALSSPVRRQILSLLRDQALTAGDIASKVTIAKPTLSGHLNVLKAADLVSVERDGAKMIYRINLSVAEDALTGLMDLFQIEPGKPLMNAAKHTSKKRAT